MICGQNLASGLEVILARFFRVEFRCIPALCLFYLLGAWNNGLASSNTASLLATHPGEAGALG